MMNLPPEEGAIDLLASLMQEWDTSQASAEVGLEATLHSRPNDELLASLLFAAPESALEAEVQEQVVPATPLVSDLEPEARSIPRRSEEAIRAELRAGLFEMIYNIEQRVLNAKKSSTLQVLNLTKWIQFEVDGDRYAIPISQVLETGHLPPSTPVPGLSTALRGLVNHRGEVLPLADLQYLLGGFGAAHPANERMLVVRTPNSHGPCALAVDRVSGLLTLSPADIKPQPGQYVSGFCEREGEVVRLLDLERLFDHLAHSLAGQASVS